MPQRCLSFIALTFISLVLSLSLSLRFWILDASLSKGGIKFWINPKTEVNCSKVGKNRFFSPIKVACSQPQISTIEQEQYGQQLYQTQQYEQAIQIWQQVAQTYQNQGDNLNKARVLSYLALAYQQLGQWAKAEQMITNSLTLLPSETASKTYLPVLAQILNNQGLLQMAKGETESALTTWEKASQIYQQISDQSGFLRSQINKTRALERLGLYPRACQVMIDALALEPLNCKTAITETSETLAQQQQILADTLNRLPSPLEPLQLVAWHTLGETFRAIGKTKDAMLICQYLLQNVKNEEEKAEILLNLGKTAQSQGNYTEAINWYQQAAQVTKILPYQLQSQLAQLKVLTMIQELETAIPLIVAIEANLKQLPLGYDKVSAQINFVVSLTNLKQNQPALTLPTWQAMAEILVEAHESAKKLGSQRLESYALGNLGTIYEQTQQWSTAQSLTEQALLLAQAMNAPEITYRWQWQLGRILQAQGKQEQAIAAYTQTVKTLESIQDDLIAINQDVQFSFREEVEPVYRELVSLLLQNGQDSPIPQAYLQQARDVIELLQVAQLNNFLQEACLEAIPQSIDELDQQAAVIYPIILDDQLAIILSLPQQPLQHYIISVTAKTLETTVAQLRYNLVIRSKRDFYQPAQQLYQWLITPLEAELAKNRIKTLIFVLDGVLRNIPLNALYDGQQYLIEKYETALTPGLQLLNPQRLQQIGLNTLGVGLTEARAGFPPLYYVEKELAIIAENVSSDILLNEDFTAEALQEKIQNNSFPIVHIATHGQFSSQFDQTFILAWDSRIDIRQLDRLLKGRTQTRERAIELLVLSACETASGDQRATLGLAGMAVRSGARSTLATLWSVNDEATSEFMNQFYGSLATRHMTKASALRTARLAMLKDPKFKHPFYWSPYVLIGNWL